jgi:hypothetical protein
LKVLGLPVYEVRRAKEPTSIESNDEVLHGNIEAITRKEAVICKGVD